MNKKDALRFIKYLNECIRVKKSEVDHAVLKKYRNLVFYSHFPVIAFIGIFILIVTYLFNYHESHFLLSLIIISFICSLIFVMVLSFAAVLLPIKEKTDYTLVKSRMRKYVANFNLVNKKMRVKIGYDGLWLEIFKKTPTTILEQTETD